MVFNRHLKALNLCNHSDTIACVLYELLVASISKVAHFKTLTAFVSGLRQNPRKYIKYFLRFFLASRKICLRLFIRFVSQSTYLELIIVGFQTHVQGSTSFSFVQFSRSCCAVASPWQLVYYISEPLDCQGVFWKFFEEVFFKKRVQAVDRRACRGLRRGTACLL